MKFFIFALLISVNAWAVTPDPVDPACVVAAMPDRFHVPQRGFPKDPEWSKLMEESTRYGVSMLESESDLDFKSYMHRLAIKTRDALDERASRFSGNRLEKTIIFDHLEYFGRLRSMEAGIDLAFNRTYFPFKEEALKNVKQYGVVSELGDNTSGILEFKYQYEGQNIRLCRIHTLESEDRGLFSVEINAPRNFDPYIFKAANFIFQRLRLLKSSLAKGEVQKDQKTLDQVQNEVSEIYWLISQGWPYDRGSASMADLATRSILDWFGIENGPWLENTNANIIAMINPLSEFKKRYPELLQNKLEWK